MPWYQYHDIMDVPLKSKKKREIRKLSVSQHVECGPVRCKRPLWCVVFLYTADTTVFQARWQQGWKNDLCVPFLRHVFRWGQKKKLNRRPFFFNSADSLLILMILFSHQTSLLLLFKCSEITSVHFYKIISSAEFK